MLLIWGFKVRYKTLDGGTFYCPHEGGDRTWQRREARRWFTFFFIPIIPLKVLGEFIECTSCQSGYKPEVLTAPTAAAMMDNLANAIRAVVVAIINADGQVDDAEFQAGMKLISEYTDTPYTEEDLRRDLLELKTGNLEAVLTETAGIISEHAKESVIMACVSIAAADGDIDDRELEEIQRAGRSLGMSPAHLRGAIDQAKDLHRA